MTDRTTLPTVSYADFARLDLRVGRVLRAEAFPQARRPAFKLWIDFGPLGVKKSSVQITERYRLEDLPGRQVVAVVNFPPRQVANFMSEVLVLGAILEDDQVVLLRPDENVAPGLRVL